MLITYRWSVVLGLMAPEKDQLVTRRDRSEAISRAYSGQCVGIFHHSRPRYGVV